MFNHLGKKTVYHRLRNDEDQFGYYLVVRIVVSYVVKTFFDQEFRESIT